MNGGEGIKHSTGLQNQTVRDRTLALSLAIYVIGKLHNLFLPLIIGLLHDFNALNSYKVLRQVVVLLLMLGGAWMDGTSAYCLCCVLPETT